MNLVSSIVRVTPSTQQKKFKTLLQLFLFWKRRIFLHCLVYNVLHKGKSLVSASHLLRNGYLIFLVSNLQLIHPSLSPKVQEAPKAYSTNLGHYSNNKGLLTVETETHEDKWQMACIETVEYQGHGPDNVG